MAPAPALVLFDIDGTLLRRSGPAHREALVEAVRRAAGVETTTDHIPVQGMLDRDIFHAMLAGSGLTPGRIRRLMPELVRVAQAVYARRAPDLRRKVCPGVRRLLASLKRRGAVMGLVTGNLSRIGWKKMERAGLKPYFRYGAFAELGNTRAELVGLALKEARRRGWIDRRTPLALIGDHPNDVRAAQAHGVRPIAVATGLSSAEELLAHEPFLVVEDLRALPAGILFSV